MSRIQNMAVREEQREAPIEPSRSHVGPRMLFVRRCRWGVEVVDEVQVRRGPSQLPDAVAEFFGLNLGSEGKRPEVEVLKSADSHLLITTYTGSQGRSDKYRGTVL